MQSAEKEEKVVDTEIMKQNLVQGAQIWKKCEQVWMGNGAVHNICGNRLNEFENTNLTKRKNPAL